MTNIYEPVIHQIAISGPQIEETYVLPEGATTIGRQATNNLVFVHPLVSRKHAELVVTAVTCRLTDLGSTHGTQINRETIQPETAVLLKAGDVIEIGAFRLVYQKTEVAPEETEPEPVVGEETAAEETAVSQPAPPPQPKPAQPKPPAKPRPTLAPGSAIQEWKTASYVPASSGGGRGVGGDKPTANGADDSFELPPGQSYTYSQYLEYLPEIYRTNGETFIPRFLAMLESILAPVEWTGDNFDLFLDPKTAPAGFLSWLGAWFELYFDDTWSESAQRTVLQEAYLIYRRRGTAWALQRLLEIYTAAAVQIEDQNENLEDFTFSIRISASADEVNRTAIETLINTNKPAHTSYDLLFVE
ncbi:MAG: phage tail protein I [Chloroflexota bacterium]